jgi:hypothetical protein
MVSHPQGGYSRAGTDTFKRFGVFVIGSVLASSLSSKLPELKRVYDDLETANHAADWLTEQYDRAERRESWLIMTEFFVTLFAAAALIFSTLNFSMLHKGSMVLKKADEPKIRDG